MDHTLWAISFCGNTAAIWVFHAYSSVDLIVSNSQIIADNFRNGAHSARCTRSNSPVPLISLIGYDLVNPMIDAMFSFFNNDLM